MLWTRRNDGEADLKVVAKRGTLVATYCGASAGLIAGVTVALLLARSFLYWESKVAFAVLAARSAMCAVRLWIQRRFARGIRGLRD